MHHHSGGCGIHAGAQGKRSLVGLSAPSRWRPRDPRQGARQGRPSGGECIITVEAAGSMLGHKTSAAYRGLSASSPWRWRDPCWGARQARPSGQNRQSISSSEPRPQPGLGRDVASQRKKQEKSCVTSTECQQHPSATVTPQIPTSHFSMSSGEVEKCEVGSLSASD